MTREWLRGDPGLAHKAALTALGKVIGGTDQPHGPLSLRDS